MANVTVRGLSSVQAKLDKLDPVTRAAAALGVQKSGLLVEGTAKNLSPVDTGALRGSINTTSKSLSSGAQATVRTNIEYAMYQEFGTTRQQAQPFMRPALQKNKNKVKQIVSTEIRSAHKGI